jgi:hypothetical protein
MAKLNTAMGRPQREFAQIPLANPDSRFLTTSQRNFRPLVPVSAPPPAAAPPARRKKRRQSTPVSSNNNKSNVSNMNDDNAMNAVAARRNGRPQRRRVKPKRFQN